MFLSFSRKSIKVLWERYCFFVFFISWNYFFQYKRTVNNTTTATVTTTTTSASSGSQLTSTSLSHNTSPPSNQTLELPSMMMSPTTSSVSSTVTTVSTFRLTDLPSSTVTALTMSSQQRVAKPKGKLNNDLLKPFYAGGTVTTSRPFSAPKVKRKYAQVESKVMSHNNLYSMESPRRDNMNNAALNAASNSKIVNYVSSWPHAQIYFIGCFTFRHYLSQLVCFPCFNILVLQAYN